MVQHLKNRFQTYLHMFSVYIIVFPIIFVNVYKGRYTSVQFGLKFELQRICNEL